MGNGRPASSTGAWCVAAGMPNGHRAPTPAIARGFNLIARCAGLVGHILEEMQEPAGFHIWKLAEEGVPYAD